MTSGPEAATAATEAAGLDPSSVLADTHVLTWYPTALSTTAPRMMEQSVAAGQPTQVLRLPLLTKDGTLAGVLDVAPQRS